MTPGQRWRARRNQVIAAARAAGLPAAVLADVFDRSASQVRRIVRQQSAPAPIPAAPSAVPACGTRRPKKCAAAGKQGV